MRPPVLAASRERSSASTVRTSAAARGDGIETGPGGSRADADAQVDVAEGVKASSSVTSSPK